ncbi:MAG: FAD/NAD(P)-binding protein, partial [Flavobacterium sp.]
MKTEEIKKQIAILGGGPSGLFMYKRLVESGNTNFEIDIYERKNTLGAGMPYSLEGANDEHVTNVSDNETPEIVTSISDWILTLPSEILERFAIDPERFTEYKVLPRLLFGYYLADQFKLLQQKGDEAGITTRVHYNSNVLDISYNENEKEVWVETVTDKKKFDYVVICTGHNWPVRYEGKVKGYFDAPYPPSKLLLKLNHAVAIKGSSLTAIDAIRTLARENGMFTKDENGNLSFQNHAESPDFKMIMHSRSGMLPAVRFHLEDSHLG